MTSLPRDISRCTGSKCEERESCLRCTDVKADQVYSFFDASEMWEAHANPQLGCVYKISP